MDALRQTHQYHSRTEHHYSRYARSLGYMDWDRQPNPFRLYEGAPQIPLDLVPLTPSSGAPAPIDRHSVSQLFQDSLGLSAWKRSGHARWALRVNPSSGNLHPTEGYLVGGPIPGLTDTAGVYHYQPLLHALEQRAPLPTPHPEGSLLLALTSIFVRESWKYGERAFRYCQHDAGHAIAAVAYAAAELGWSCRLIEGPGDDALASLLGISHQEGPEAEHPDALLLVGPPDAPLPDLPAAPPADSWLGEPNSLADKHHDWPIIDEVHEATRKPATSPAAFPSLPISDRAGLREVIHRRRSAVAFDGQTSLSREAFFSLLEATLPAAGRAPFAAFPWRPRVHLALFVHRVTGLASGQYALVRSPEALDSLRSSCKEAFAWTRVEGCPEHLPLYLLKEGDTRAIAAGLSCGQEIASHGVFACAMLAEFEQSLEEFGPWFYRRLHWEAGAIGQALYLGAEAAGIRGTGIGCFFDRETEQLLGLEGERFRDLYHFTVGGPVEDPRIETLPPYEHLERDHQ